MEKLSLQVRHSKIIVEIPLLYDINTQSLRTRKLLRMQYDRFFRKIIARVLLRSQIEQGGRDVTHSFVIQGFYVKTHYRDAIIHLNRKARRAHRGR